MIVPQDKQNIQRSPYEPVKPVLSKPVNLRSINSSPYDASGRPKID